MRPFVLAALAAGLLVPTPSASAHPDRDFRGECQYLAVSDGSDHAATPWTGYVSVVVAATDPAGQPAPGTPITVRCVLKVNGVERETVLAAGGAGVAAGAATLSFQADPDDVVELCDHVTVGGEEHVRCPEYHGDPLPHWITDAFNGAIRVVEENVCAVLVAAAPGVPGVVDVEPGGDTYVAGELFWDCPPWETA